VSDSATPLFLEDHISQVPALQFLQDLGWTYVTEDEALKLRGGRASRVLLTGILGPKLAEINRIEFKGENLPFSEANVRSAIEALEDIPIDGLVRTSEKVYDLLRLPKSLQQTVLGDTRSFDFWFIDWQHPERNAFHVTEEFEVERTASTDTCRPDIVLFINGIPVAVIECKKPGLEKPPMEEAISQQIRNQKTEFIPRLFLYTQLLLAVSKNEAMYGTTGTPRPFWSVWREPDLDDAAVAEAVNRPLTADRKERLFAGRYRYVRRHFDALEAAGREVTEQDRALYALCRPTRLLELMKRFILYDGGEKKIARYQQYFCVRRTMERVSRPGPDGRRPGGVVWHTQGSGKSLTMVMLATAIAEDITTANAKKVVLVTDRVDLDEQIEGTFHRCGMEPKRATTGRNLVELLRSERDPVITTVIDKFETAVSTKGLQLASPDIFVLVDESHRGQYGTLHARMRRVLPNACFLGFTGTPVIKAEKDTVRQFGGLIDTYTIQQAVIDKAVVPLLYEGRNVPQIVDREQIDRWFERITQPLTKGQAADLKRKFSTTSQLNKAEQKVAAIAWDIGAHFAATWRGTGFKGQLVAQDKATALLYKKHLDECGLVTSEVLISAPDDREGDVDILEENKSEVVAFWRRMMERYGTELQLNRLLINAFKNADEPEIIVVVDKLLTGFDAPRDVVLYLTRPLKDHTLLQAIARVNRVYEGKEFGYVVDYAGVLQNLEHALDLYGGLPDFDREDLAGTLTDVAAEIAKLRQRHGDLWDLFRGVKNRRDEEEFERVLGDDALRAEFYERLSAYARNLQLALSTLTFLEQTPEAKVETYRRDVRFFVALRGSVRRRYAEVVDFGQYEPRIQRLLDVHVGTGEVEKLTGLVNIFDREAFAREVEKLGSAGSKADTIAYRTKVTIKERWAEDPAYYERFSAMLEQAIAEYRAQRLSDAEYLKRVAEISASVLDRTGDVVPEPVRYDPDARALFGVVREAVARYQFGGPGAETAAAATALAIDRAIEERRTVHWTHNSDVQNQMRNAIEDELFELKDRLGVPLALDDIDSLMERCLDVARARKP
jgi:type I restriction enzyme R subunit